MDAFRKTSDRKKEIYKTIENNNELVKIKTSIDDIETNLNKYFETDE
jgi:NAD(P)H-nitrite reductase large subunit